MSKYITLFLSTIFFSVVLIGPCLAGDSVAVKNYTYSIGGYVSKGFVVMHDKKMGHLAQSHPQGISLFFKKHTYGYRDWEKVLNYPDIGVSLSYFNYNNPFLGETFSAVSYMDYYLIRKAKSTLNLHFGFGLCYATDPYHPHTNNKNIALGSTFSYAAQGQIAYNQQLAERIHLFTALRLSHYSNGAYKKPNKGINIATADIGIRYALSSYTPEYLRFNEAPLIDRSVKYHVSLASGVKEIDPVRSKKFPFLTLSVFASKQVSLSNSLLLGIDGFYSTATREERRLDRDLQGKNPDFKRVGLFGGHELLLGKLSFLTQLGVYVYRPYKTDKPIYQRYGFKYTFNENIFCGMFLKSHYGKAEAVEWSIGLRL